MVRQTSGPLDSDNRKADEDLEVLGEQMMMRKTELMKMAGEGTLPPLRMEAVT